GASLRRPTPESGSMRRLGPALASSASLLLAAALLTGCAGGGAARVGATSPPSAAAQPAQPSAAAQPAPPVVDEIGALHDWSAEERARIDAALTRVTCPAGAR